MSTFRQGDKVQVVKLSDDPRWESYMNEYVGYRGIITDPDMVINDPEALVEVTLEGIGGTHRLPQDCLQIIE
ncbi:MAG TPA: hypothetical protein VK564_09125 [Thermodesulfobacteriota bacterium]|nr:hypothetical protein [Thermodesulfobacteriota bacterium]